VATTCRSGGCYLCAIGGGDLGAGGVDYRVGAVDQLRLERGTFIRNRDGHFMRAGGDEDQRAGRLLPVGVGDYNRWAVGCDSVCAVSPLVAG